MSFALPSLRSPNRGAHGLTRRMRGGSRTRSPWDNTTPPMDFSRDEKKGYVVPEVWAVASVSLSSIPPRVLRKTPLR